MTNMRSFMFIALSLLCFAGNSIICRLALRSGAIDPSTFTSVRLFSGAIVLTLIVAFREGIKINAGKWTSALALFVYAAGFSWAYMDLTAATGALILFGSVQLSMILFGQVRGEKMRPLGWIGFIFAIIGLILLFLPGLSRPPLLNALLMIAAGIAWGIYSIMGKQSTNPILTTAGNFVKTIPFILLLSLVSYSKVSFTNYGIILAFLSGAVTSGIGYAIWYSVLPGLTVTNASILQLSVPILGAIGGIVLLSEEVSVRLVASTILVLSGIWLVIKKKN